MRLVNGFKIFDVSAIIHQVQLYQRRRLENIIATDPLKAEDMVTDQNKIQQTIMVGFLIKIFKLGLIIVNICYFLGLIWFIFAEIFIDIHEATDFSQYTEEELLKMNDEHFITYYELEGNSAFR